MMTIRTLCTLLVLAATAAPLSAQINVHRDSTSFDEAHARLREIDFEDVYSFTLQRVTVRNPWGLHVFTHADSTEPDTLNNTVNLGQGATIELPTRTRSVHLVGMANDFFLRVFTWTDSTYDLPVQTFPVDISDPNGIRRIQFRGIDFNGSEDINWNGGLWNLTLLDEADDTLVTTAFEELAGDSAYFMNIPLDANAFFPDSAIFYEPMDFHGITLTEPNIGLLGWWLGEGEARVDDDNPIGNLTLGMTPGASIEFGAGVEGALLTIEGIQVLDTFYFEVEDNAGVIDTVMETGWGREYDTTWVEDQRSTFAHLGLSSAYGLRRVTVIGLNNYYGAIPLAAVHVAEAPQTEVAQMEEMVDELAEYRLIGGSEQQALAGRLASAIERIGAGDRSGAVEDLRGFRGEVLTFGDEGTLVDEETRRLAGDAAYVISRLTGAASVGNGRREELLEIASTSDGLEIRYHGARRGDVLRLYDLQGRLVWSHPLSQESGTLRPDPTGAATSGTWIVTIGGDATRDRRVVTTAR